MSEYNLSYTGAEVNELLSTVSDNHDAWDSISQTNHIIDEGTSGDWTYRKWSNGVAECWFTAIGDMTIDGDWGQFNVSSDSLATRAYPFSFIDYPSVSASVYGANHGNTVIPTFTYAENPKTNSPIIHAGRPAGVAVSTVETYVFAIYAIGRWE